LSFRVFRVLMLPDVLWRWVTMFLQNASGALVFQCVLIFCAGVDATSLQVLSPDLLLNWICALYT